MKQAGNRAGPAIPSADALKRVKVSDLSENEMQELRSLVSQFGDVTLLGDKATLHQLHEASANAKRKSGSVMKKRLAEGIDRFVASAAAARNLYYREYQKQEGRRQTFGTRFQEPDEDAAKRKRRRQIGEYTIAKRTD